MRESRVFRVGQNVSWPSQPLPQPRPSTSKDACPCSHPHAPPFPGGRGGGHAGAGGWWCGSSVGSTWAGSWNKGEASPRPIALAPNAQVPHGPPARPTHATPAPSLSPRARTCIGASGCGRAELAVGGKARAWVAVHVCRREGSEMSSTTTRNDDTHSKGVGEERPKAKEACDTCPTEALARPRHGGNQSRASRGTKGSHVSREGRQISLAFQPFTYLSAKAYLNSSCWLPRFTGPCSHPVSHGHASQHHPRAGHTMATQFLYKWLG